MVSIIVPALNEASQITETLSALQDLQGEKEIMVVDGGSDDETAALARHCGVRVLQSARGRGIQLHAGAAQAHGSVLWFVHADTLPPGQALNKIECALRDSTVVGGNFGLTFDGPTRAARLLTGIYPTLRWLNLCYGDSGVFVRRDVYEEIGGFRPLALFEDLDLLKRLRKAGRFVHLECRITTSSRRFENRNFALMWTHWTALQVLYWGGVSPNLLARWYRHTRRITG
ncbi:MAG: TIGR04283 family arsenosugar biosynthesis glycosyltransferase [Acidobacteriota bacterium]|nr:TIGR04283 family arsenosugar biosynthesis glycosyltransferase [Acidobacteriota bacterium]